MFWTSPDLGGLELLKARYRTHVFRPHVHEGYALGVVVGGVERYRCRGESYLAGPGDIIVIAPDTLHDGEAAGEGGWTYRMMYPKADALARVARQMGPLHGSFPYIRGGRLCDPDLSRRLIRLHRALEAPATRFDRDALWLDAISLLVRRHGDVALRERRPGGERHGVRRAKAFLDGNLSGAFRLTDVAGIAGLSPYHFLRVFKAETGVSPRAYLTHRRVRHAKRLIGAGEPIAGAAADAGFVDQSHLTRHFKAIFGFTPGQYRRAVRF